MTKQSHYKPLEGKEKQLIFELGETTQHTEFIKIPLKHKDLKFPFPNVESPETRINKSYHITFTTMLFQLNLIWNVG